MKYLAHHLTKSCVSDGAEKLSGAVQVDLNPDQVDAALFTLADQASGRGSPKDVAHGACAPEFSTGIASSTISPLATFKAIAAAPRGSAIRDFSELTERLALYGFNDALLAPRYRSPKKNKREQ